MNFFIMVDSDPEGCTICFDAYDGGVHTPMVGGDGKRIYEWGLMQVLGRCGHTYCRSCVTSIMRRAGGNCIRCPECQRESDEACVV